MCRAISKVVLVLVNVVFALLSITVLAIGIWVAAKSGKSADVVDGKPQYGNDNLFGTNASLFTSAIVCIVVGGVGTLLSVSGCVGALRESSFLLSVYSVILGLLVIAELVIIGLVAAYSGKIGQQIASQMLVTEQQQFLPYYMLKQKAPMNQSDIMSHVINSLQVSRKCCGVHNYSDITQASTAWSKASPVYNWTTMKVPASCCKFTDQGVEELAQTTNWTGFNKYLVPGSSCPGKLADFHDQGCFPVLEDAAKSAVVAVLLVSAIFAAFNIACIVMACCLIKKYKTRDPY